jgi:hypothetical protein
MSAIWLSSPAMWSGSRDDACRARCLSARNRSRRAAGSDVDVLPQCAHVTKEVLSQNIPTCLKTKSLHTPSSTSHPSTSPASSKSLIVSLPVLFVPVTSSFCISGGHLNCHTQCCMGFKPGVMTPPALSLHASVYWM